MPSEPLQWLLARLKAGLIYIIGELGHSTLLEAKAGKVHSDPFFETRRSYFLAMANVLGKRRCAELYRAASSAGGSGFDHSVSHELPRKPIFPPVQLHCNFKELFNIRCCAKLPRVKGHGALPCI